MNGVDFVKEIETKLIKFDIPKDVFYAESGVSTANMSQWRTGKFNPSSKAIEKVNAFFNRYKKEKTPIPEDERDYAQNEHEARMLLLARHIAPIPEEQRNQLIENFTSSADIYLKLIKKPPEDQ